ncbi:MAG: UDP-N-acetylmuramoyl-L-alanyl-D-glutamate--2,6-diaminopimelate ligase [Lachnospiraceae bacterium]|jgi:UDP-N-acetylmuramoyl-L-alanyl-D-glutamate--2,6-diaminopimelate ligase|nr:UDP-N-acetylmuramoyl-L-alanyl-D-glutamate--2,6-diaminopimelate ligase [Lachnospiraceae bacterium]
MKLSRLLEHLEYECIQGDVNIEIAKVVYDSRKVEKDSLFLCISGLKFDGHLFATKAVEDGAIAVVVSTPVEGLPSHVTVIRVADTRYAMALISAAYFEHPAKQLKVIGITGTKGKTTTTYMIKNILENAGRKVGLVGTIEVIIGNEHIHAGNTTPESYLLQEYFKKMVDAGLDTVVMEVSSQALKMHRTDGFTFEVGVFTNLDVDHIAPGEHDTFEEYRECKAILFRKCRYGIVNIDDENAELILKGNTCESICTFGMNENASLRAQSPKLTMQGGKPGIAFRVLGSMDAPMSPDYEAKVSMPGLFSVYNSLAAIAVCRHFLVREDDILRALSFVKVKGRIEVLPQFRDFTLLIDYAHNAMALRNLLTTLREYQPTRLICLFGCGGDRARDRRFQMGEVSGELADLTIITTDNPRTEDPYAIMADIKAGLLPTNGAFMEICDRKEAIRYAITHAKQGDMIVLAGKGHEDYQEIHGVKYPMDERSIVAQIAATDDKVSH